MILIPIGHEQDGTRRLPWITFGVMILCALAFFMTGPILRPEATGFMRLSAVKAATRLCAEGTVIVSGFMEIAPIC